MINNTDQTSNESNSFKLMFSFAPQQVVNLSQKEYIIRDKIMKNSSMQQIKSRIEKQPQGTVFVASDFADITTYENAKKCLLRLANEGFIRRIIRGVYDRPYYSNLLEEFTAPDIENLAMAIARNYNWVIAPSGITALNLLGLSTQVPFRYEYYSSGQYKTYKVGNISLYFKHKSSKELLGLSYKSCLIVNAIKEIGPDINKKEISIIRNHLLNEKRIALLKEGRYVTKWIFGIIKTICN